MWKMYFYSVKGRFFSARKILVTFRKQNPLRFEKSTFKLWQPRRRIRCRHRRIVGSWHEVGSQCYPGLPRILLHIVSKTFERLWARAQSSWVICSPIFEEQIRICNAKSYGTLWGIHKKNLQTLNSIFPGNIKLLKIGQYTKIMNK